MKIVIKPWGKEEWLELNDRYCYKRIYINAGYKTSYQYHNFKTETNYIISGEAEIWLENDEGIVEKKIMKQDEFFNVKPTRKHRVIALTDLILQEVSTPEVDDVVRIEDDNKRVDGKIEGEHKTPAVLILSAGTGSRLKQLTEKTNKVLLPINNKAIISHIISKFPSNFDFIITKGYKGDIVEEYCKIAFPNHNFTFVTVDKFEGEGTGPGYSALRCEEYLQRPFYFITGDCMLDSPIPPIDCNWVGAYPTSYPEKYSTLKTDDFGNISEFVNKSVEGNDLAFIGLAAIWNYEIFWDELKQRITNGEIVTAFENPSCYPTLKVKEFKWLDTGNFDDLSNAKKYFNDKPISIQKTTNEITYKENHKLIKFSPNSTALSNRKKRADKLTGILPDNVNFSKYFMSYDWVDGKTLYECDSIDVYTRFLDFLKNNIQYQITNDYDCLAEFYIVKTNLRLHMFMKKRPESFYILGHNINGKDYDSMEMLMSKFNFESLLNNPFYSKFHGDLQFDNVVLSEKTNSFVYIDWRDCFGECTDGGDVYYDLAKLYGGLIIPYNLMKDEDNIKLVEGLYSVTYEYEVNQNLSDFKKIYEKWLVVNGFDLEKVKLITALIFLNMSPLHDDKFSKLLWFKSIEMLSDIL